MKIQIVADHGTSQSAWTKAPADVATIAERLGFVRVAAGRFRLGNFSFIRRVLRKLHLEHSFDRICWKLELISLRRMFGKTGGELLLQHPLPGCWTFDLKNFTELQRFKNIGVAITVIVHDVGFMRGSSSDVGGRSDSARELRVFSAADKLIVHNERMRELLSAAGISRGKMVPLGVFDYLMPSGFVPRSLTFDGSVIVAGALGAGKSKYIEHLRQIIGVKWKLYGPNYDPIRIKGENVVYCGCYQPDEVPLRLNGAFGLVWDGDSVSSCTGATGTYLKYNNPHKLSLYLACGIPVIVWKESAVATLVEDNGIGICVQSLTEIPEILRGMTKVNYAEMQNEVARFGERLRNGLSMEMALKARV